MDVHIRTASRADFEAMSAVFEEGDLLHRANLPDLYRKPANPPARSQAFIEAILADPDALLMLAEKEGQVIGVLHATVRDAPDVSILMPRRYGVINDVAVQHELRGLGVGQALMRAAEEWAHDKGAREVELNVYFFNQSAINFYELLGYEPVSQKMRKKI